MKQHGSVRSYTIGFIASLILTGTAFWVVERAGNSSSQEIIATIFILAIMQLIVQLIFFLHLGREEKPRLNLMVFSFMLLVVGIIVGGSLWIMSNLNYNMHQNPYELDKEIMSDEAIYKSR